MQCRVLGYKLYPLLECCTWYMNRTKDNMHVGIVYTYKFLMYVTCMDFGFFKCMLVFVVCTWDACYMHVTVVWLVCGMQVTYALWHIKC